MSYAGSALAKGALLCDPDGGGSQAAVQFASVSSGLSLTAANFKVVLTRSARSLRFGGRARRGRRRGLLLLLDLLALLLRPLLELLL